MVNDRILVGVLDRKLRMAGAQARPDLCQDPRPIAVAIMIADIAGQRRNKSGPQIILASAIFRTVWVDKGQPIFPQQLAVDVPAVFLDRVEPYKLQIQIVVRKRLVQRLRIILNVEQTRIPSNGVPSVPPMFLPFQQPRILSRY